MTHPLSIITGASRGLGRALAELSLARGHQVVAIARNAAPGAGHPMLQHWTADLADAQAVAARLESWLRSRGAEAFSEVRLINNAGVVTTPAPLADATPAELAHALRVGLEAPALLTAALLRATHDWPLPRKVVLVSSGLGRRAMAGSAAYCAAKAGLDHLARAVALEEAARPGGARIASLAPGVIDTDMQQQLRDADAARFPERARFVALQRDGLLDSPAQAAAKLLACLDRADFGSEPVGDVRGG